MRRVLSWGYRFGYSRKSWLEHLYAGVNSEPMRSLIDYMEYSYSVEKGAKLREVSARVDCIDFVRR